MIPISSREYKVILKRERFAGPREVVSDLILDFWKTFQSAIEGLVPGASGKLDKWEDDRLIRFFDTSDKGLLGEFLILRERSEFGTGKDRTLTLKFRSPDRFLSQGPDVAAAADFSDDLKFEEDLKLPYRSLYSRSNKIAITDGAAWPDLGAAAGFFPGLARSLPNFSPEIPLSLVNGKAHRELVVKGAKLLLGDNPEVKSSCALILWYSADDESLKLPEIVEFSFNHKVQVSDGRENLPSDTARRSYEIFKILGDRSGPLAGWVDPDGSTKTDLVYG